jgi:pyridoxine/pyridoxamine 5'-phosphate oxidase
MKNHCQTPEEIRQQIWKELGRATQDRHHAWRTPVLATAAEDGLVNARTVVLRGADAAAGNLVIFTDERSPKLAEIRRQQAALFVFWSSRLNWQLRVRVRLTAQTSGPEVDALWQRVSQSAGASDYMSQAAPGTVWREPADTMQAPSRHSYFAVLSGSVTEMDWLELGREGHRRARIGADTWEWLTP